ncbi:LTA synthase family protein [Roseimarinus sediminis]|uniref:LTA synthase family protein n=1 Tax=Roseimarinus sediminis TaxID=1610899 RepID=UPI003D19664B
MNSFLRILWINASMVLSLRIIELALVLINFGHQQQLFCFETLGLIYDLAATSTLLLVLYPVYFFLQQKSSKAANTTFVVFVVLAGLLHLLALLYFSYQLDLPDAFVYQYPLKEIYFTLKTTDGHYFRIVVLFLLLLLVVYLAGRFFPFRKKRIFGFIRFYFALPVVLFLAFQLSGLHRMNRFSINKSLHFYRESFTYFTTKDEAARVYTESDALDFQLLNRSNSYLDPEYPLLHKRTVSDFPRSEFRAFSKTPNLVLLIVEGLGDDFIHAYHGVELMPFLSSLKDESLYWDCCFTLGERSFAAVPSLCGSLPYGKNGFTLADELPRHLSLISVLNAVDYHTSFFYGQGAWFHKKDRFFRYNQADLVFDKSNFSSQYERIVTGDDQFFWGYNDRDLFDQSLQVIDTLPEASHFICYFTGSSHSPFSIPDRELYDQRYASLLKEVEDKADRAFLKRYQSYLQSLLFVDDALHAFVDSLKQLRGFEETVFVITGDHPMSEVPLDNRLKKYHVPLLIYGEGLRQHATFHQPVSHLDLYESLLDLVSPYVDALPEFSTALGGKLDEDEHATERCFAFMNGERKMEELYCNDYFLTEGKLYQVDEQLHLSLSRNNEVKALLKEKLDIFKHTNHYVCSENKLLPAGLYCDAIGHELIASVKIDSILAINQEYFNLLQPVKVGRSELTADIQLDSKGDKNGVKLVLQLKNENDSTVYWTAHELQADDEGTSLRHMIPEAQFADSLNTLSLYLWNPGQRPFGIANVEVIVHH